MPFSEKGVDWKSGVEDCEASSLEVLSFGSHFCGGARCGGLMVGPVGRIYEKKFLYPKFGSEEKLIVCT